MLPSNKTFDIAFFAFNGDQDLVIPGLKNVIRNVPDYQKIILVWDDFVRVRPVDFEQIQNEINHELTVIKHTDLMPWPAPWPDSIGRWGWIKQQLAKMMCHTYSDADYTWICDADVLVTGNPELFVEGKPALRIDSTKPIDLKNGYYDFITRYYGITDIHPCTWIGSTCLLDNKIIKEMWEVCQQLNSKSLIECVQEVVEAKTNRFPFSEFELYGNYCYNYHKEQFSVVEHNWNYATI